MLFCHLKTLSFTLVRTFNFHRTITNADGLIVPTQVPGNQLRIDAFISFLTVEDCAKASALLQSTSGGSNMAIRPVDASRYYAATSPGQEGPSMAEFLNGSEPKRPPPAQSEPTNTIWLGNIPIELLYNKDEIIQKFSKYGPLIDVRIRKDFCFLIVLLLNVSQPMKERISRVDTCISSIIARRMPRPCIKT
jgi:hypothetical protein